MPEIEIRFASDQEYDRLCHIRDKHGVQWRGMLLQGAKRLEEQYPAPPSLPVVSLSIPAECRAAINPELTDPDTEQRRSES